jgi:hypothetical protein
MGLLARFDAPVFISDFNSISGQFETWHRAVSSWFDTSIRKDTPQAAAAPFQFYSPTPFDPGGNPIVGQTTLLASAA